MKVTAIRFNSAANPEYELGQFRTHMIDRIHGFKMRPICDKTATSKSALSWPNNVFAAIGNVISALE